jgi:WD40 repeat protein
VDVDALAVTPDGKLAITNWARAGALYIWDLESCRGLRRIRPVCRWSYDAVVMPNAVDAVSASDRSLTVWRIRAGVAMAVFTADSDIRACAVTPDGKTIVAGDALGRVHFVDYLE